MATFSTYAEVLTPEHAQARAFAQGLSQRQPGLLLRDLLNEAGGRYEHKVPLTEKMRGQLRTVAQLPSNRHLADIAALDEVTVSLEHLRHLNPDTTRIVCGLRLDFTQEEVQRFGLYNPEPHNRSNTIR